MPILYILIWVIFWWLISFWILRYLETKKISDWKTKSVEILFEAKKEKENILFEVKKEKENILFEAKKEKENILFEAKKESNNILDNSRKESNEILKKSEKLEEIDSKQNWLVKKENDLKIKEELIDKTKNDLDNKLSELSKLSMEEARILFLDQISKKYETDALTQIEKYKKWVEERKNEVAREIIIKSIQQYASDVTSEVTTTLIPLPNDDIKWKLIGKEGRNIVAFERATWVALIIDDTPDSVFISAFDLFKRYIAKKSLEKLLEDWRVQPARIEEIVEITTNEADILLKDIGKKTLDELNITWIPEEIIPLIWKLRFRTSYGQNILRHSIEVAYISESIARDLNLDSVLAKKWWLLHDIWKALDHDIEWTHPEIWAKVGRKYWLWEKIIDMIENHHGEHSSISIYAAVVQMADAISSVRPGARRESIEQYVKRVKEMEALVQSFSWVSKAYAISAWREVRIFVDADTVSDYEAHEMARNIALDIEAKLNYPWEVKVNLIRELRVIQYAK